MSGQRPREAALIRDAIAYIEALRSDLKQAHEIAGCCYAVSLNLPHCDAGYCRCGKAPITKE